MTLVKKDKMNLQPMLELLWTPWLMVTQVHKVFRKRVYKLTVVKTTDHLATVSKLSRT